MDRSMIDVDSGGALMDKTPVTTRHLISNMASNTQQFGIKGSNQPWMVNEIGAASNQRLENQLIELTSLVRQLAVSQHQPAMAAKICDICTSMEHPTNMCPTLQETESDQPENVGAIGGFQYGKQPYQNRPFDNQQQGRQPFRPGPNQGPYATQQFGSTPNTYQRQAVPAKHDRHHPRPQNSAGSSNLPSQTIPNPRGNASVVTLRSGKELPQPTLQQLLRSAEADSEPIVDLQSRPKIAAPLPFPSRTISARKPESNEELLKMF
ncbi:hypothetical protein CR513_03105, partial [Mucuna pruriens]